ncbi:hypothetical protein OG978_33725 [Streptomyces sp. NBC_01591]|uniref:hypothetical protein n=1 Tax=Streptomyces sp. NBC_01591 TaxID=2975888 RepID=UPI002DDA7AB7|nr:hypothetical protein [Streptomyces sp. NBC_01591]WSD71922.1 hypothetical protein OG978_33725 [Streptomyces sp. NBC_01591]
MTTSPQTTDYHYVITIQMPGAVLNTRSGILAVPPGITRAECLKHLLDQLQAVYETQMMILFFSLEPNQL